MPSSDRGPGQKGPQTFFFIGVSTGGSAAMRVFPRWAAALGLGEARIVGIDCALHDDPSVYRGVVERIRTDPLSPGALVTSHKIDLFDACRDLFDRLDPYAELLGEVSCISKEGDRLVGSATDPAAGAVAMRALLPAQPWSRGAAELCLLGAGGAARALACSLTANPSDQARPRRVVLTDREAVRLDEAKQVLERIDAKLNGEYVLAEHPETNDEVVSGLPPGSMVVNATGLGKDRPGSPITGNARFPKGGQAWELNYRGELLFVRQAKAQQVERALRVEDGWYYFLVGWALVLSRVFHREVPTSGPLFDRFREAAESARASR